MTAVTDSVPPADMRSDGPLLVVEGASSRSCLKALSRRIAELRYRQRVYASAAHELAHQVVALNEANDAGMAAVLDTLALIAPFGRLTPVVWRTRLSEEAASLGLIVISEYHGHSALGRPSWLRFSQMLSELPLDNGKTTVDPTSTKPEITFQLSSTTWHVRIDLQAAIKQMIDDLIAIARSYVLEMWKARREQSQIHSRALSRVTVRAPNVRSFVLVIIAACRHYGRRSEPDHFASLLIRRHLVPVGSCPPI